MPSLGHRLLLLATIAAPAAAASHYCTPAATGAGCHTFGKPSCPSTHTRVVSGGCRCRWGRCWGSEYRCDPKPACCSGWAGGSCDEPVCSSGCGGGSCVAPGQCLCPEGWTGARCEESTAPDADLRVVSMNFACRDVGQLAGCDNCPVRFAEIAKAFRDPGSAAYSGVPDLREVDVLFAQELGTSPEKYAVITEALEAAGLIYSTGAPGPTAADPQCSDPPLLLFGDAARAAGSALSGLDSGGLVTFSRHPITAAHKQNWCGHNLPVPAGYQVTMLDVGGVSVLGINLHAFPQFDFGVDPEDVRAFQFTEVGALADKLAAAMRGAGASFATVLGGDFNEDAYALGHEAAAADCGKVADAQVIAKLAAVGLDLPAACAAGAVGAPSWDPTHNDLAARFSHGAAHEVLDYVIRHSASDPSGSPAVAPPRNVVRPLKKTEAWAGSFCESATLGTLGTTYPGTAHALTDHNVVTASVPLPRPAPASGAAATAFRDVIGAWVGLSGADAASCGQAGDGWGTVCASDAGCCGADYAWAGSENHCSLARECSHCSILGEGCNTGASSCCGQSDYSSGTGQQCELGLGGFVCIPKLDQGERCVFDDECHSRGCDWSWEWLSSGYFCA